MHSIGFSIGIFEITLSLFVTFIGAIFWIWMLTRTVHEKNLSLRFLSDHIILFSAVALFTGRLGVVLFPLWHGIQEKMLEAPDFFIKTWVFIKSFFSFWHGGIDLIWAIGGLILVFLLLCGIKNEHPLSWMDAFSLPSVFFLIFYSLGTFFSGKNYGRPVSEDFWLSVSYDLKDVQYSGPVHAVQIYESILLLSLFFIAWRLWDKSLSHNWPSGIFGGIILSSMFLLLGLLEFLRWDTISYVFPSTALIFFSVACTILLFMFWRGHFWVFSRFKTKFSEIEELDENKKAL